MEQCWCRVVLVLCWFGVKFCAGDYFQNSNYFCTDLKTQQIVDISQLEGIWYVIEKLIHTEERHYTINLTTCPVIHISEDRKETTTYNPLYKTYDTTYGSGYPYNRNPTDPRSTYTSEQEYIKQREQYDRITTYDHERRRVNHAGYVKHLYAMKYLRIYWDDNSYSTEYHLRYNVSRPGFWISSGPEDGRTLPEDIKHFAGTVQVLKAVGNHLVLTFCHRLPEQKQLFTVILSRENRLDIREIHGVHGILIRKGLSTNALERTCNGSEMISINYIHALITLGMYFLFK
ncbi:uncharacterized protein LOC115878689 [Sitophilus oryzae]|uniref:Uncharacterized protein LOC115878689 n=1 Tax=Sitophilus oryzae TaxID=7048 RepID=A0A6J2XIJ4_SITOR|nr:uncharacterized protein LOC115878689 [Sitophilus oryzae]